MSRPPLKPAVAGLIGQAAAAMQAGRLAEGRALCKRALAQAPGQPDALNLLGAAALQAGSPAEAERAFAAALKARPGDAAFLANLGQARLRQGAFARAEEAFRQATAAAPGFANGWRGLGEALLAAGRPAEAVTALETLVRLAPASVPALALLGDAYLAARAPGQAAGAYRAALARDPAQWGVMVALTRLPPAHVPAPERLDLLRRAAALRPHDAGLIAELALALAQGNQSAEATAQARAALALDPGEPLAPIALAQAAFHAGDLAAAEDWLDAAAAVSGQPHAAMIDGLRAQVADRQGRLAVAVAAMRRAHARQQASAGTRGDPARYHSRLDALEAFAATLDETAPATVARAAPVFFVGFPRSGTTLMEQVLAAHPAFATTDEQPLLALAIEALPRLAAAAGHPGFTYPRDLAALPAAAREQAAALYRQAGANLAGGRRLVDKLPLNLVDLPAAAALFPGAPVIVALRDPRDVVVSNFLQLYDPNPAMANMASLESAARLYDRVMGLWLSYERRLGLPSLVYRYEDLVDDFDRVVGQVLAFLGEPWDEAVRGFAERARRRAIATPSAAAVGQGLNRRAVGRWQAYAEAELLDDALPILAPWVERFGYS